MSEDTARINDQLGRNPDTFPVLTILEPDTIWVEDESLIVSTITSGNATIVGSATNGIVGVNLGTVGGGQQVVGGAGRILTVERVVSNNNSFVERFTFDRFEDTSNTDATTDYVNNIVNFTAGQIYTSLEIFKNLVNIDNVIATFSVTGSLKFEVSANDGLNWSEIGQSTTQTFSSTPVADLTYPFTYPFIYGGDTAGGQVLRYRVTENGGGTATLSFVQIRYNI